ncbi:MAG: magnesium transporter, partial [Bacillota bacterium]
DLLFSLSEHDRVLVFRSLPRQMAAKVAAELDSDSVDALLRGLTDEETRAVLTNLKPDDRTSLLEEMPGQLTQRLLNLLSPEDLRETRALLGYPEGSVGRLMTPDYVAVRSGWTVGQALDHIRKKGKESETVSTIYVVDGEWKLLDALDVKQLILADPSEPMKDLMDYSFASLSAFDDREKAVLAVQKHDLFVVPVVDSEGVLLGIVTADDVLDVAQEEVTEDFHRTAAVSPLDDHYTETSVWELYTKRIGWLVALILMNLVSSGVMAAFEKTLASSIALAFFIPLLIDSGGNAGSQSATLMIRALATGNLKMRHWTQTLTRELIVGVSLGLTMGITAWLLGMLRGGFHIGLIVGLSMTSIVMVANLIGTGLPFLLTRFGVDPAVASSPLITTVADAAGLVIYFSLARVILG